MRPWAAIPLCLAMLAAGHAAAAEAPRIFPWYTFSRVGQSVAGNDFLVQVSPPRGSQHIWIALRVRTLLNGQQTEWIDGRACPALAERMATLKALEPLTVHLPTDPAIGGVLDGELYSLKVQGYFAAEKAQGEMTLTGNVDTPLAKWTEDTMTALKSCWQDGFPG
jgi:hypothetical protein